MIQPVKKTSLYDIHKKLGAKMVPFAGWEMPIQYSSVIEEHQAVRQGVGLFDISHMGEIFVTGPDTQDFINYITTNDITQVFGGQCQYSVCCYEDGSVVDDVITYQFNPEKCMVVVNAANIQKDWDWFVKNKKGSVTLSNLSDQYSLLALQGPKAKNVLQGLVENHLDDIVPFNFVTTCIQGKEVIISHTGYTGEDGFEIYSGWNDGPLLWEVIMKQGKSDNIHPCGLGARDTLRLEVAYSLYGHEIDDKINPLEARLGWTVKLDKKNFIGKKALQEIKQKGCERGLVGLEMIDKGIPRQGYSVFAKNQAVGFVTSGTYGPTLQKGVGLALIKKEFLEIGSLVEVEIRGKKYKAKIVKLPFYTRKK